MAKPEAWVKFEELEGNGGRFVVAPLDRGMGTTLGNSLRRVLLSSLGGYAATAVKIDGVKHEFSTIPNVVEDVIDIISNLKSIVFTASGDEPVKIKLESKKKGVVKAKDFALTGDVKIVNGDQYIAEIADGGKLSMELTVEKGIGYRGSELQRPDGEAVIDEILLDSSFTPIVKVNHQVENIRVGKELDHDSLKLDVWTNGSVTAEDAVRDASKLLLEKFGLFHKLNEEPESLVEEEAAEAKGDSAKESALSLSIDDLELSARSSNCLKRAGIETVAELIEKDMSELIQIKNFGKKSADEINSKLKQFDLALKGTI